MDMFKEIFNSNGRISRKTYLTYMALILIGLYLPVSLIFGFRTQEGEFATNVLSLVLLWPSITMQIKRWHDRNKSAWWVLVGFIPVIGALWAVIELSFYKGTDGPNKYGEDPLNPSISTGDSTL